MDTAIVHISNLIISVIALIILTIVYRRKEKSTIIPTLIILVDAVLINVIIYSCVFTIDKLDSTVNVYLYNWWSLFMRGQTCATILAMSIMLYLRGGNE